MLPCHSSEETEILDLVNLIRLRKLIAYLGDENRQGLNKYVKLIPSNRIAFFFAPATRSLQATSSLGPLGLFESLFKKVFTISYPTLVIKSAMRFE